MKKYHVYIMANHSKTLYTGITNNLMRRLLEHRTGQVSFTNKYKINKLVYAEEYNHPRDAIIREKQIKGWVRNKKIALIETLNSVWFN